MASPDEKGTIQDILDKARKASSGGNSEGPERPDSTASEATAAEQPTAVEEPSAVEEPASPTRRRSMDGEIEARFHASRRELPDGSRRRSHWMIK